MRSYSLSTNSIGILAAIALSLYATDANSQSVKDRRVELARCTASSIFLVIFLDRVNNHTSGQVPLSVRDAARNMKGFMVGFLEQEYFGSVPSSVEHVVRSNLDEMIEHYSPFELVDPQRIIDEVVFDVSQCIENFSPG